MVEIIYLEGVDPNKVCPERSTEESAGYDLKFNQIYKVFDENNEEVTEILSSYNVIKPKQRTIIGTGVKFKMSSNVVAKIVSRSGLTAKKGLIVLNAPGIIDSDYKDEIMVILSNTSNTDVLIEPHTRIAQVLFEKIESIRIEGAKTKTDKRQGGLGSTGQ